MGQKGQSYYGQRGEFCLAKRVKVEWLFHVFALRENEDTYNVGWHFNKRFEGKGFACEAAAGLLDYLFREAGARRIYGFVEDDNIRSKRLCERLGMRREGCFKEFVTFVNNPDGSPKYEDTCVYAILEKEWNTIRQW